MAPLSGSDIDFINVAQDSNLYVGLLDQQNFIIDTSYRPSKAYQQHHGQQATANPETSEAISQNIDTFNAACLSCTSPATTFFGIRSMKFVNMDIAHDIR